MRDIKAVIFDLDGVLVDATELHYEALNRALGMFGYSIGRGDHISVYNGLPTYKKLERLTRDRGLPPGLHAPIRKTKKELTERLITQKLSPSYEKILMLNALGGHFKLACCSNAIKESVVHMLTATRLLRFFDLILGNDEIKEPKPHPEIYLTAFERLDVRPEQCVVVEDAPHGIEAAKASGAHVIEVKGYEDVNIDLFRRIL